MCLRYVTELFEDVNSDLKVVNVDAVNVTKVHIPERRVEPGDS